MEEDIKDIKDKLKKELNAELYEEASGMYNRLYNQFKDLDRAYNNEHKWYEKIKEDREKEAQMRIKAETEQNKWENYYREICIKQAKLEIELDIAKEKIKLLSNTGTKLKNISV